MASRPANYNFAEIEKKWQQYWAENQTFRTAGPGEEGFDPAKPKFYVLDMFPYPSGAGLHVGHPEGYTATDIVARYRRMRGYNVLHPMGWDAFGLPAEQYAIEHNVHPAVTTRRNIDNMRRQIKMFGFSYDWNREFATTDPDYYRWTQWIFLQMFNSWYDPDFVWQDVSGRRVTGKARPITELIEELESGRRLVDAAHNTVPAEKARAGSTGLRRWQDLTEQEKRRVLENHRLAYMAEVPVNWCPALGTVLANEEVTAEGRSERGNFPVFRRPMRQWMLRITRYADRLLADLDLVDWPESIKIMQRNWIGRSEGAEVDFPLAVESARAVTDQPEDFEAFSQRRAREGFPAVPEPHVIRIYTTRPDTLFGATYMVLAPEHPLVEKITTAERRDKVLAYVEQAKNRSELERTAAAREKTGVFTGAYAINPVNGEKIPIWVADYVLMGYGTGAIMAVPAHDERDFEFARAFGLPIKCVVRPSPETVKAEYPGDDTPPQQMAEEVLAGRRCFVGDGVAVNSGKYDGLSTAEFKRAVTEDLAAAGLGRFAVNYKLRDWLFSRQRYWGEPFPVVHCEKCGTVAIPEDQLPIVLPDMQDFKPRPLPEDDVTSEPEPPLARATEWVNTTCPQCGGPAKRETNTMPQWAGSCWYYLRFIDPKNAQRFCDPQKERYWMPVDLYIGGAEHAVLHLLYARFWHKVLYDLGHVSTPEPFAKLFNQGMIRSYAYRDSRGVYIGYDEIDFREDGAYHKKTGEKLIESVEKMSKSLKNVINPDDVIAEYGADTFRLYEMYMGPLEASKPWNTRDVPGVHRFLHRTWRLIVDQETGNLNPAVQDVEPDEETLRLLHKTIKQVTEDIENMRFNTAIAAMIVFVNEMTKKQVRPKKVLETFMLLLAPFAPHIAEELWQILKGEAWTGSLAYEPWPRYDENVTREKQIEIAVQVNGKVRARVTVPADIDEESLKQAALENDRIRQLTAGKQIKKVIAVPGRLVNIVVG